MVRRFELRPGYTISKIIKGAWHLAGGHGTIDPDRAIEDMRAFVEAGITTFDCADIYTGVEELIGQFLSRYKSSFSNGNLPPVQVHTKYVPDYDALATLSSRDTEAIIDRSLKRLGVERLDLVQFAWWDYSIPGYIETALDLKQLQQKGKIRYIGLTNFDAHRIREFVDNEIDIIAHQVQYSILDRRIEANQLELAKAHDFSFLTYGSVAGGFLSNRYLHLEEPSSPLENRSLTKYKLIVDEFGGWDLFQESLRNLDEISKKYQVGIAEIAIRYVLQKDCVAAVIVGARNKAHLSNLSRIGTLQLNESDIALIHSVTNKARGPQGPFYALERDKEGKHGSIMKYNLNKQEG